MGKGSKKKTKKTGIDYDALFDSSTKKDDGWQTGSMAIDDVEVAPANLQGKEQVTEMDTTDVPRKKGVKVGGLGVKGVSLKVSGARGNRTVNQKKRKVVKLEKALARAEKDSTRVTKAISAKQKKLALRSVYS